MNVTPRSDRDSVRCTRCGERPAEERFVHRGQRQYTRLAQLLVNLSTEIAPCLTTAYVQALRPRVMGNASAEVVAGIALVMNEKVVAGKTRTAVLTLVRAAAPRDERD